ncbi:GAF domain-containing protein [Streptomyces rectiviolaceus]|uniref:GAF domain-containing protein n=1 Tax=Streptomyces rectiviolaceus TaxID=332591 RepID=A0ABP6M612_9ACTN
MPDRPMAAHLLALTSYRGAGMPLLPLTACTGLLGLDGLAFTLAPGGRGAELLQHSGLLSGALEDLQRVQGQGPTPEAAKQSAMVLIPDVAAVATDRWPGLPGPLTDLGIAAVFALPLRIGVITLGVLTGHRTTPGPPADGQLADSLALANALAGLLINLAARPGATGFLDVQIGDLYFAEVHQATGYLATELDVPPAQALIRLRSHAFTHGLPLLATARAVLHHQLHLENDRP